MQISDIETGADRPKENVIADVQKAIAGLDYQIIDQNFKKPWGAYFTFAERHAEDFINRFFADYNFPSWVRNHDMNPKFLLVAPNKEFSWQYHKERGEVWKVVKGPIQAFLSENDKLPDPVILLQGETTEAKPNTRHRIGALDAWALIAEIWVHAKEDKPSTEADIVRLEDDYGRAQSK